MPASFETVYKLLCALPRSERAALLEYLAWREASVGKTEAREDWEEFSEVRETEVTV